jgi:hypothetical protein
MPRTTRIITIPKPGPEAFNKNRAAGTLLRSQTVHLRHALSKYVHEVTTQLRQATELLAIDSGSMKKEGEVSAYAERVMTFLHPHGVRQPRK